MTPIAFTPGQIAAFILALVGFILTLLNIVDKVTTLKAKNEEPIKVLSTKVDEHDVKLKEIETSLLQGNDRFREQDSTNEVMQTCMLALIDFELAYCIHTEYRDTEDLIKAKEALRKHLAGK